MSHLEVWWTRLTDVRYDLTNLLNQTELTRLGNYQRHIDRMRFLGGVGMARLVAGNIMEIPPMAVQLDRRCRFCGGPHGKPRIVDSDIGLSVTHSGLVVGLAVSRSQSVGLDVESVRSTHNIAAFRREFLSTEELARPRNSSALSEQFDLIRYWVRKEAVVKATGDGIAVGLPKLTVTGPACPPALIRWPKRPLIRVSLYDLDPLPDHAASLAVLGDAPNRVIVRDGSTLLGGHYV